MTEFLTDRAVHAYPHGKPLPPLSAGSSDELLCITMMRDGSVLANAQRKVLGGYENLLAMRDVPVDRYRASLADYHARTRAAIGRSGSQERSPQWWAAAVEVLRNVLTTYAWVVAEEARLLARTRDEEIKEVQDDKFASFRRQENVWVSAEAAANAHRIPAAPDVAMSVIAAFAARGHKLSVSSHGGILCTRASVLTDADRAQLVAHKGTIVAALADAGAAEVA